MTTRAQSTSFPVVPLLVAALGTAGVAPYYPTLDLSTATLEAAIIEGVLFVVGFWPWLLAHPVNLVLAAPMLLYVLLLFSRPVVRAKQL